MEVPGKIKFGVIDMSGGGMPVELNERYRQLLDQGVNGGPGTAEYLRQFQPFADLASYLNEKGASTFVEASTVDGIPYLTASDGHTTLTIATRFNPNLVAQDVNGVGVIGVATVTLDGPDPYNIVKVMTLGVSVAELPPSVVVNKILVDALVRPVLNKVRDLISNALDKWSDVSVEDVEAIADDVEAASSEAVDAASEEAAELIVEEVALELTVDFAAAFPALIVAAALLAIPLILNLIAKKMTHHLQIVNLTKQPFAWEIAYTAEGAIHLQPLSATIPAVSTFTDVFGNTSDQPVAHAADFSVINTSGFAGIGYLIVLTPAEGSKIAIGVSIPFTADNALAIRSVPDQPVWADVYNSAPFQAQPRVEYGDFSFFLTASMDALSGNNDDFHSVVMIQSIEQHRTQSIQ